MFQIQPDMQKQQKNMIMHNEENYQCFLKKLVEKRNKEQIKQMPNKSKVVDINPAL